MIFIILYPHIKNIFNYLNKIIYFCIQFLRNCNVLNLETAKLSHRSLFWSIIFFFSKFLCNPKKKEKKGKTLKTVFLFAPWVMHFSQHVIQLIACFHLFFTSRFPTLSCISIKSLPCSSHCLWLHYKVNSTKSLKCIFLGYSPPLKGLSHWFGT